MRFTSRPCKKQTAEPAQETSLSSVLFLALKSNRDHHHLEDLLAHGSLRATSRVLSQQDAGVSKHLPSDKFPGGASASALGTTGGEPLEGATSPGLRYLHAPHSRPRKVSYNETVCDRKQTSRLVASLPLAPHRGWGKRRCHCWLLPSAPPLCHPWAKTRAWDEVTLAQLEALVVSKCFQRSICQMFLLMEVLEFLVQCWKNEQL